MKFTHEIYPEHTTEASRQVLLITELEVRDRLESSQINKFLYQYTSEARPKQSHAHMVSFVFICSFTTFNYICLLKFKNICVIFLH